MNDAHPAGPIVAGWTPRPAPEASPIQGRLVRLEPLSAERHGSALFAANGDDRAMWDFMGYGPFASEADYLAWAVAMEGKPDPMFFALLDRDGRPLGVASWLRIDRANGSAEVGHIAYAPALRRRPEATEAMHLMARAIFDLGYRRYEWKCNANNLPSRRAAERLGFSYEGTFRQHMVVKGMNRDTAWFAMTDTDWPAVAEAHKRWLDPSNFDATGRQRIALADLTRPLLVTRDPALV